MSDLMLSGFIRAFDRLSLQSKAELIAQLADRLSHSFDNAVPESEEQKRESALDALVLAWKDVDLDGDLIVGSRTASPKVYDL